MQNSLSLSHSHTHTHTRGTYIAISSGVSQNGNVGFQSLMSFKVGDQVQFQVWNQDSTPFWGLVKRSCWQGVRWGMCSMALIG